jgi:uncharacterized damage-inducible protein DinB
MSQGKQDFLTTYQREHETTMRVLRAYPKDKLDLRPHPKLKTARELAWVFVLETGLGTKLWDDGVAKGGLDTSRKPPEPPADWDELLAAVDKAHKDFHDLVASVPDEALQEKTHFFIGPKQLGEMTRKDMIWFLLHDQIHHRGQFSVYLRMSDASVPSIYGPTADEPWV